MSRDDPDDDDRYPGLSAAGRAMLAWLRAHPRAPIFRNASGHRLTPADRAHAEAFRVRLARAREPIDRLPESLTLWLGKDARRVPAWRDLPPGLPWSAIPTTCRADLAADVTRFVPDDLDPSRLVNYQTTGTTGHPLVLPSLPGVAACYQLLYARALARFGVRLAASAGRVGVALIGWQQRCFTYVSVTPLMGESGLVKLNLHPDDWRDPEDRAAYLDAIQAELYTGDPIGFSELMRLPSRHRPAALVSTSMQLLPALREALQSRFGCPVLDLYSMNETGPIAVYDPAREGHVLLQPEMWVEIVDDAGRPLPDGEAGEICISSLFNPCLPLLRYRTGDFAALHRVGAERVLRRLQGRAPVRFAVHGGGEVNNIDLTHALKRFPLAQWQVQQDDTGAVRMRYRAAGAVSPAELALALAAVLGAQPMEVVEDPSLGDRERQYQRLQRLSSPPIAAPTSPRLISNT